MGSSYDTRPIPIPGSSRSSFDYQRSRSPEPRRMNRSPSWTDPYNRYSPSKYPDPYRVYQRAPSPGVYEKYRDTSVEINWNGSTTWYHPRSYHESGSSPRDRGRRDSNGSATSRTFEPSDSWKREREHQNSKDYSSDRYPSARSPVRNDKNLEKASWPPNGSSYNQERSFSRDNRSPERSGRASDSFRSFPNSYNTENRLRNAHFSPRSPKWRYRSRSRSPSRSHSSRSVSRPRSLSPRSRLPARSDTSTNGSVSHTYRFQDGTIASKPIPTGPRRATIPSPGPEKPRSRSSSPQSSIASSRETSVKPSASRPSDPNDGSNQSTVAAASKDESNISPSTQLPAGYSLGSASELLNILRSSTISVNHDANSAVGAQAGSDAKAPAVNASQTETAGKTEPAADNGMDVDVTASSVQSTASINASQLTSDASKVDAPKVTAAPDPPPDPVVITPRDPIAAPPPQEELDFTPPRNITVPKNEDIPDMSTASSVRDAVRIVVMRRILSDRLTRQERIDPVLFSNFSLRPKAETESEEPAQNADIHALMTEMTSPESEKVKARTDTSNRLKQSLVERFEERQGDLKNKVQKLREEYVSLHEKWKAHCAMLDRHAKGRIEFTADGKASPLTVAPPPVTGRTTRRSAASLGDAVRSDLEMEQIIASLESNGATDPNQLCLRNEAVIPDMISVVKGKVDYVYDDNNLRVEDPLTYYAPQTDDWTEEEKQIFIDKFAIFPKQFGAISRFLPNKTTAQCVDFYYLHKNVDIDFKQVVAMKGPGRKGKRRTAKRKANALLADIRKHDAEVSSFGTTTRAASGKGRAKQRVLPAPIPVAVIPTPILPSVPAPAPEPQARRTSARKASVHESTPTTATPTPEPEARPKRRRVSTHRASLGTSQFEVEELSEPASAPVSEPELELEPEPEPRPAKKPRRIGRRVKSAAMISDDINDEDDSSTPPPLTNPEMTDAAYMARQKVNTEWSESEQERFLQLLKEHGADPLKIASGIPTKSASQCSDYYHANEVALSFRKIVESRKASESSDASSSKTNDSGKNGDGTSTSSAPIAAPTAPGFPTSYADMAAFFAQAHPHFSRFTTGVSPYGAAPTPGAQTPFSPLYGAYFPAPTPAGTGATPYAGRPYIPYPFSYQAGYPPMAALAASATRPPTAAGGTTPTATVPTPNSTSTVPPNPATAGARNPYLPGFSG